MVEDIITPLLGILIGGIDLAGKAFEVGNAVVTYGNFIQAIINFFIIAFVLFLIMRSYNRLRTKEETGEEKPAKEELPRDVVLLTEIRDILNNGPAADPTLKPRAKV